MGWQMNTAFSEEHVAFTFDADPGIHVPEYMVSQSTIVIFTEVQISDLSYKLCLNRAENFLAEYENAWHSNFHLFNCSSVRRQII